MAKKILWNVSICIGAHFKPVDSEGQVGGKKHYFSNSSLKLYIKCSLQLFLQVK